jgi:Zn-dependent peptidase ImmA (M78 family)/DNA-binding XRE family transcriptional regulator
MAAAIPAEVNPDVLAWAREQSGYPPGVVARRVGVKPERLIAWEQGQRKPTVRQTQELARYYHRPFGVFFLPQPPALPPLAAEYRRLPGVTPGVESPEFRLALRIMSSRREATLDLQDELGVVTPSFTTAAHVSGGALAVGRRIRQALALDVDEQLGWRDEWQAWRTWRSAVEAAGILVFLFPKVPLAETRGVSLLEFPLPAVGINSREQAPGARIFSLLHEVVHIALALGHEERVALRETRNEVEWEDVERFAEEAASEAIVPGDVLDRALEAAPVRRDQWTLPQVRLLANRFRVTPLAMATRLRAAGALSWEGYQRWKAAWSEHVATLEPRKGGIATPVDKTLARAGRPFAQLVLEALDANRITAVDAAHYLDLRFDHFETLRSELRAGQATAPGEDTGE